MFWVISVYFNIRNTLPKSGTFLLGHLYIYIYIYIFIYLFIYPFILPFHWHVRHAKIPCRSQENLPFLSVYNFSFHPFPPTSRPSTLTSSSHLFLGLPLSLVVSKFIHVTFLGILFSSILSTCPNQRNVFKLIVSLIEKFLTIA